MTAALVLKLLRDLRLPLFGVAMLLLGFEGFWSKIAQRSLETLNEILSQGVALPFVLKMISEGATGKVTQALMGGQSVKIYRMLDLLSIGFVHPLFQTILCVWAIGRSSGAIAGEIDRGTMELLLAQPVPRWRVVLAHLLVDLVSIPLLVLSLWAGSWLGLWLNGCLESGGGHGDFEIKADPLLLAPALPSIAGLVFAMSGLSLWMSARGRFRNRVMGIVVFVALLMFLVNIVGQLWELFVPFRQFTVFYYYQPQRILLANDWNVAIGQFWTVDSAGLQATEGLLRVNGVIVLFVVALVGYGMALVTFCRRDLPAPL
jgi:ABC-2 type transport system permease protein